jgi:hypothetical protein
MSAPASIVTTSFATDLRALISWVDEDTQFLTKEEVLDKVKSLLLRLMQRFLAFPHGTNFALMPAAD